MTWPEAVVLHLPRPCVGYKCNNEPWICRRNRFGQWFVMCKQCWDFVESVFMPDEDVLK